MKNLLTHVEQQLRARGLFRPQQAVLVAVSGGLDSMVLLDLLHKLAPQHQWRLTVAHLNHRLRGRSSAADEALVRRTAKDLGLPIAVEREDVRRVAELQKLSIEMAARKVRHEFLARVARQNGIPSVALAHHADDQLESFFLRLLRGSGGEGLGGMKWKSESPADRAVELVRPLLDQSKEDLRAHACAHRIQYREDASNNSLDFLRNRVRHRLLPLLKREYQPGLDKTLLRVMDIVQSEAEVVTQLALARRQRMLGAKSKSRTEPAFEDLPVALQRRCLQQELLALGIVPNYELVEQLRLNTDLPVVLSRQAGSSSAANTLKRGHQTPAAPQNQQRSGAGEAGPMAAIRDSRGGVQLRQIQRPPAFNSGRREVVLGSQPGRVLYENMEIRWRIGSKLPLQAPNGAGRREFFDADRVGDIIALRHWQPGDRFWPSGMPKPVKLQDLFTNQKVSRKRRHDLIMAVTEQDEVFWVEGMRISERFKLTNQTKRCLQWRWQRL
jgi:tRNA(Ile)-lysidine synthase